MGEVIKAALTKEILAQATDVATLCRRTACRLGFRGHAAEWGTEREGGRLAGSLPEEVTSRIWELAAPSPPSLSERTSMM